mgnify:CR=1 FL=1
MPPPNQEQNDIRQELNELKERIEELFRGKESQLVFPLDGRSKEILNLIFVDRIFFGYVNSDGTTGTPFPKNWTSSRTALGTYSITHSFNTTAYIVLATCRSAAFRMPKINARNVNNFVIEIADNTNALADSDSMFIAMIKL